MRRRVILHIDVDVRLVAPKEGPNEGEELENILMRRNAPLFLLLEVTRPLARACKYPREHPPLRVPAY